jgi:hypothetical protein
MKKICFLTVVFLFTVNTNAIAQKIILFKNQSLVNILGFN